MTEQEAIAQTAAKYRDEGYAVALDPDPATLPAELRERRPAMIATRNGKSVVVEIWTREKVNDLPPAFLPPGWDFDVVVVPQNGAPPNLPVGPKPTREYVEKLLNEVENCLPLAAERARFLLAWSAVEAAMRVAAEDIGLDSQGIRTRQLISELASAGLISQERYSALQRLSQSRNALAHGVPAASHDPAYTSDLISLARDLIAKIAVPAV